MKGSRYCFLPSRYPFVFFLPLFFLDNILCLHIPFLLPYCVFTFLFYLDSLYKRKHVVFVSQSGLFCCIQQESPSTHFPAGNIISFFPLVYINFIFFTRSSVSASLLVHVLAVVDSVRMNMDGQISLQYTRVNEIIHWILATRRTSQLTQFI